MGATSGKHSSGRPQAWLIAGIIALGAITGAGGQTFLTEEEMLATLPGAQIAANDLDGNPWSQTYGAARGKTAGGDFSGVWKDKKYKGKWQVKDGQWCEATKGWQGCFQFARKDAHTLLVFRDGKPDPDWTLK